MVPQIKPLHSPAMLRRRSFIFYTPPPISEREVASNKSHTSFAKTPASSASIKNGPVSEAGSPHSPPPVEDSEERPSVDQFYQERSFTSAPASSETDGLSDSSASDQTVQNDKENVTKTGACNPHGDKKLLTSTNGFRTTKQNASSKVLTKPRRATAGKRLLEPLTSDYLQ